MLQIYTGNGKGKTTSALGLAVRALGHNKKVCLIQFMKKNFGYGEIKFFSSLSHIDIFQFGTPNFVDKKNPKKIDLKEAERAVHKAESVLTNSEYDIVILDEINVALHFDLVSIDEVMKLIEFKDKIEIILTGRYADERLIEAADLVTEMKEIKHYFNDNVKARKGIEY